jgi:hypothetical protein
MNDKGRWPNRVADFFRDRGVWPIKVEPKHPRRSGPVETPSDWWSPAHQLNMTRQCVLCHEHALPGEPLKRGLCGPCYLRTLDRPDAA